ncbi:hypothetical protein BD408DRAFT_98380 [Parasitella parasitica]|nr:hypothetical protein BD408DRAFT_98380 [Parasitella parasitica]
MFFFNKSCSINNSCNISTYSSLCYNKLYIVIIIIILRRFVKLRMQSQSPIWLSNVVIVD